MAYLNPSAGARRAGTAAALTAADLAPDTVAASEIAAGAVGTSELATGGVATADIASQAVTFAKAAAFVSTEQTGTGAAQNVAHGLGVAPAAVLVVPTEHPGTPDTGAFDIAEGTHTTTNVVVTVTLNVKFKVLAWV